MIEILKEVKSSSLIFQHDHKRVLPLKKKHLCISLILSFFNLTWPQESASIEKETSVYMLSFDIIPDTKNHPLITIARKVAQISHALSLKSPFADIKIFNKRSLGIAMKNNEISTTKFANKKPAIMKWDFHCNPFPHDSLVVLGSIIQIVTIKKKLIYHIIRMRR